MTPAMGARTTGGSTSMGPIRSGGIGSVVMAWSILARSSAARRLGDPARATTLSGMVPAGSSLAVLADRVLALFEGRLSGVAGGW